MGRRLASSPPTGAAIGGADQSNSHILIAIAPGFEPAALLCSFQHATDHHRQRFGRFVKAQVGRAQRAIGKGDGAKLAGLQWPMEKRDVASRNSDGMGRVRFVTSAPFAAISASTSVKAPVATVTTVTGKDVAASEEGGADAVRPTLRQYLRHPVALLSYIPKDAALFFAGAVAGGTAKTVTAPLDRWKLMLQVRSVQAPQGTPVKPVGLLESFLAIGQEEGVLGYWRGNLPQVIRIIPYSAVQLFAYEMYKKAFMGKKKELSVPARLAAGACAGMTSTLITYPLDVLRLRLAVDPTARNMSKVALTMLREEGALSFYKGLGPSLISIAPYIALNFCAFDLIKRSIPEKYRKTPQASFVTALCATSFATVMCYPLDTVRRQMQMKGSPFNSVLDAVPGIIARDGVVGLYRGFIANALKNLPNSSIRLTTYDTVKQLISSSREANDKLVEERKKQLASS